MLKNIACSHISHFWGLKTKIASLLVSDFYSLRRDVQVVSGRVEEIRASAGIKQLEQKLAQLELKVADSSFWDDRTKAQETLQSLNDVKDKIKLLSEFKTKVREHLLD